VLKAAPPAPAGHDDLVLCDLVIDGGKVADVAAAGTVAAALGPDLDRSLVLPGMLDAHAHLDKGHIAPRARNETGDLLGAAAASVPDREARWHAEDVRRRGVWPAMRRAKGGGDPHASRPARRSLPSPSRCSASCATNGPAASNCSLDHRADRHVHERRRSRPC
jgi:hypothetical protein